MENITTCLLFLENLGVNIDGLNAKGELHYTMRELALMAAQVAVICLSNAEDGRIPERCHSLIAINVVQLSLAVCVI